MDGMSDKLADLLLRWEEAWEHGDDIPASQLCESDPDLLDELQENIENLKRMAWMIGNGEEQAAEAPDRLIATTLGGRYRIESLVASGGFGRVYKAFDPELERHVAVKVPNRLESNGDVTSLVEEARRVAKLRHPGIVAVHDVGTDNGTCFIVSELIEGKSLAEVIREERPSAKDSVLLVARIADNLQAAHNERFIHRDIKPANILIDVNGNPLLTDFGIATTNDELASGTIATSGTLPYMAPEQVAGETQLIDARTDIYSLGVVLYELLTGESPYQARTPLAMREQILFRTPQPVRELNPAVTTAIEAVCMRCLTKHPADRFGSASELAVALRNSLTARTTNFTKWLPQIAAAMVIAAIAFLIGKEFNAPDNTTSESATIGESVIEGAFIFDGASRIVTPLDNFAPCTLEAWIYPTSGVGTQFVVGSDEPYFSGIGFGIRDFYPMVETVRGGFDSDDVTIPQRQWTHMAVVYGTEETRVYVNGRVVAVGPPTQAPERVTPFVIGNLGENHNKMYFSGRIRSVRISGGERYHHRFVPDDHFTSDVATSANRALLTYDASQVEGAGQIADISGNKNHGYWQGTATADWQSASPEEAAVAGMILDLGGEVEILDASGRRRVLAVEELPTAPFYVTEVKVLSIGDLKDDHVQKLSDLRRLDSVYLAATGITDDSLKVLGAISTLRRIGVGSTKVTDDGVAQLTELPRLTYLHVANTNITAASFQSFLKMNNLRQLHISLTNVTEEAVKSFEAQKPECAVRTVKL